MRGLLEREWDRARYLVLNAFLVVATLRLRSFLFVLISLVYVWTFMML